jgi:HD-GYP domain-containing protein (c-di-GMP phosphodiesterase class II)
MVLAMSVSHPASPGIVLLRAGCVLDDRSIHRLREIGVREAWIRYPSLEGLAQFANSRLDDATHHLNAQIGGAIDACLADTHARLDFYAYKRAVMGVVESAMASPRAAVFLHELAERAAPAVRHAGNVCVLSLLMGLKLESYLVHERARVNAAVARELSGLGVGAMFHDVGMLRLPEHVRERFEATGDESDPEFQEHARLGFDMVKADVDATAAATVLHHHQRHDGSGFPRRVTLKGDLVPLKGSDIHVFARVVACADVFDRIRSGCAMPRGTAASASAPTGPGPLRTTVAALAAMLREPYTRWIDPIVLRALLAVVPAFAPGTIVDLSDGRRAVVVDWTPANPCAPTVQVVDIHLGPDAGPPRASGGPWAARAPERINLADAGAPRIARVCAPGTAGADPATGLVDVAADLFFPKCPGDFDLSRFDPSRLDVATLDPTKSPRTPDPRTPDTRTGGDSPATPFAAAASPGTPSSPPPSQVA